MTMPDPQEVARIAQGLSQKLRTGVTWFTSGSFVVGFRPEMAGLSHAQFKMLQDLGLIEDHWTWASTTCPDTGLSPLGRAVRDHLRKQP